MKCSQSSGLRLFVTKARRDVVILCRLYFCVLLVLDESSGYRRSALRLQRNASLGIIVEGIHFFLYDIGSIAYAPLKQLSVSKARVLISLNRIYRRFQRTSAQHSAIYMPGTVKYPSFLLVL